MAFLSMKNPVLLSENGICKDLHSQFHGQYGTKNTRKRARAIVTPCRIMSAIIAHSKSSNSPRLNVRIDTNATTRICKASAMTSLATVCMDRNSGHGTIQ